MDRLTYTMANHSKKFLQDNGFRFNRNLSDSTEEIFTYRFPVISYKTTTTIECEISVSSLTGITTIDVLNANAKELYASYYNREFGNYEIIKIIDMKIKKKMNELGIEET